MYFDLDGYFKKEARRLTKTNQSIEKTVIVNGKAESKNVKIDNWEQEFNSFIAADINKASWKSAFKVEKTNEFETYTSNSEKIPVKKLIISFSDEKVVAIKIFIVNTNDLYVSNDSLSYYPDSLYQLKKTQKIKLMDGKKYQVTGKFN